MSKWRAFFGLSLLPLIATASVSTWLCFAIPAEAQQPNALPAAVPGQTMGSTTTPVPTPNASTNISQANKQQPISTPASVAPNPEATKQFAEQVQDTAIINADATANRLREAAKTASTLAQTASTTGKLPDAAVSQLENTLGVSVTAPLLATSPQHAAVLLNQVAAAAASDASNLAQISKDARSASPAATMRTLATFDQTAKLPTVLPASAPTASPPVPGQTFTSPGSISERIGVFAAGTGGATSTQYESVGLLLFYLNGEFGPSCTGTLVSSTKVVTAAHCFCPFLSGMTGIETADRCRTDQAQYSPLTPFPDVRYWRVFFQKAGLFEITNVTINPQYQLGPSTTVGDVAVVTLATPVLHLSPAVVSLSPTTNAPNSAVIVGFGYNFDPKIPGLHSGVSGDESGYAGLKLWSYISLDKCERPFDPNANLCWTSGPAQPSGSGAICDGDSGGPMLMPAAAPPPGVPLPRPTMIGVNSAGEGSCAGMSPSGDTWLQASINSIFVSQQLGSAPAPGSTTTTFLPGDIQFVEPNGIWNAGLNITSPVDTVVVTLNGPIVGNLTLGVISTDDNGPACKPQGGPGNGLPGIGVCTIDRPRPNAKYQLQVSGIANKPFQIVAVGYSNDFGQSMGLTKTASADQGELRVEQ